MPCRSKWQPQREYPNHIFWSREENLLYAVDGRRMSQEHIFREDWFQNSSYICLSLYVRDVDPHKSTVTFDQQTINVSLFSSQDNNMYRKTWNLAHPIVTEDSTVTYLPRKVELKMKKKEEGLFWKRLSESESICNLKDRAEGEQHTFLSVHEEDNDEEEQGHNKDLLSFFREIYDKSDEDTRRAMIKSFVESQGKVLSTDWKKVSEQNMRYE